MCRWILRLAGHIFEQLTFTDDLSNLDRCGQSDADENLPGRVVDVALVRRKRSRACRENHLALITTLLMRQEPQVLAVYES